MSNILMSPQDWNRVVSRAPYVMLKNRLFESNPALTTENMSLISRPGAKKFLSIGTGPIRGVASFPGTFAESAFAVSGDDLYRINTDATSSNLGTLISGLDRQVIMAATQNIGDEIPEHLFIADGILWVYAESGYAVGTLTFTGAITATETVEVNGVYYQFTSGSVDAGTPDGTVGNPWQVTLEAALADSIANLANAIRGEGDSTKYSTALTTHTTVWVVNFTSTTLAVRAIDSGALGNAYTTTETLANGAWGAGTLSGGGSASLVQVPVPGDVGAISVAHINSYVIVIPTQGEGVNGRFYWIEPGETTIDPLNFATAERSPDAIHQCIVFGDMIWFLGQSTTEAWIPSGDLDSPFRRFEGVLFDRGTWEGSGVQVKDSLIVADDNGRVFQIGGQLKKVSNPQIEERIRRAIQDYGALT